MIPFGDYITEGPMGDDIRLLADPALDPSADRDRVDGAILNVAVKYMAAYLNVGRGAAREVREGIRYAVAGKRRLDKAREDGPLSEKDEVVASDYYPVACHADLPKTAALFKEVAFGGVLGIRDRFSALEIGSGTGILTLAAAVAARRARAGEVRIRSIELRGEAVRQSRRVLGSLFSENEVSVVHADALEPGVIASAAGDGLLDLWISETISTSTPAFWIDRPDFGLAEPQRARRANEADGDPIIEVVGISLRDLPDFKGRVRSGRTIMVPDVVNDRYHPSADHSTLRLRTFGDRPRRLGEIGSEFRRFEGLGAGSCRWGSESDDQSGCAFLKTYLGR